MARGGGGVGDGRRVGARIGGGTRLVAPAMIVGRASRGRAGAAARPPRRASPSGRPPPGPKKKQAGKPKAGAKFDGSRPPHGPRSHPSTSFVPFRTLPMARCSSCLSNADVPLDDIGADAFARSSTDPTSSNQKESLRPFAQRVSRLKFRAPRPDRRARSCCDASVSVDPPRVRLFVNGCGMSEAELGRITGVVRGALPRKAGECPHAACRTSNASVKSSNARALFTCSGKQPPRTVRSVYSRAAHPRAGLRLR